MRDLPFLGGTVTAFAVLLLASPALSQEREGQELSLSVPGKASAPKRSKNVTSQQKTGGADSSRAKEKEKVGEEEDDSSSRKKSSAPNEEAAIDPSNGRSAPAQDARGWKKKPGVDDDDVALAIPRAIIFLPRMALYVLALPIYGLIYAEKEVQLVERAQELMYFDDAHNIGWTPSLSIITTFGATLGATVFHKSLFGNEEELSAKVKFGGRYTQFYQAHFNAERLAGTHIWLESLARFEADRSEVFGGIGIVDEETPGDNAGPRSSNALSYYGQDRVLGAIRTGYTAGKLGGLYKMGGTLILNDRTFVDNRGDKVQTSSVYDTALIPGYNQGATTLEIQANLILDHRANRGLDSRGAYFETFAGSVPAPTELGFFHYGFEAAYTIDLYKKTRLLTLRTALEAVEADNDDSVPFTSLPRLGGHNRLRGYMDGRYRDTRMALASVEYRYPIHQNVMGEFFVDTGYVSNSYRDLYDVRDWKVGYGGGLVVGSEDSIAISMELAYGEELRFMLTSDLAHAFHGRSTQL